MIYFVLFIVSTVLVGFYTFFEMAYLLSSKVNFRTESRITAFLKRPERVIITVLVGTNLWAIAASMFFRRFMGHGSSTGGVIEGGLLVTGVLFVFSEMLPKNIATHMHRKFFFTVAPVIWWTYLAFSPLINGVEKIMRRFYGKSKHVEEDRERDVIAYMAEVRKQLPIKGVEAYMDVIEETVRFLSSPVIDYAMQIKELNFIDINEPDYKGATVKSFSLVYEGTIDNVIGILKGKYIYPLQKGYLSLEDVLEDPLFVHEGQNVKRVLNILNEQGRREAIIVDEHGNVKGAFTVCSLKNVILNISKRHFITLWGSDKVERLAKLCSGVNTIDMQETLHDFLRDQLGGKLRVGSSLSIGNCRLTIISLKGGITGRIIVEMQGGKDAY